MAHVVGVGVEGLGLGLGPGLGARLRVSMAHVVGVRVEGLELVDELPLRRLEGLARRHVEVTRDLVHLVRVDVRGRGRVGVRLGVGVAS